MQVEISLGVYLLAPTPNRPTAPIVSDPGAAGGCCMAPGFARISLGQRISAAWVNLASAPTGYREKCARPHKAAPCSNYAVVTYFSKLS